jgi:hypothetical protein
VKAPKQFVNLPVVVFAKSDKQQNRTAFVHPKTAAVLAAINPSISVKTFK